MKVLLDENLPKSLKASLRDHNVSSVEDEGWRSIKNGELLKLMIESGFDVLITLDQKLQHQQNLEKYPVSIVVFKGEETRSEDSSKIHNTY